jgi:hypothetical protein
MGKKNQIAIRSSSWNTRTILGGALIGACAGIAGAYLLTRRAAREGGEVSLTPMQGLQIGMLIFGLLRAIASLGDGK